MLRKLLAVNTPALMLGFVACGGAHNVDAASSPALSRDALNEAGQTALAQANVVEGDYESISHSSECLALRTKLTAKRKALQASDVWSKLSSTAAYKAFEQDKVNFRGAGCDKDAGTPSEACAEMQKKIDADGDAIAATLQWKSVAADESFQQLQNDFAKAKEIDCVK